MPIMAFMIRHDIIECICCHDAHGCSLISDVDHICVEDIGSSCVAWCWLVASEHPSVVTVGLSFVLGNSMSSSSLYESTHVHEIMCCYSILMTFLLFITLSMMTVSRGFARELRSQCTFPSVRIVSW